MKRVIAAVAAAVACAAVLVPASPAAAATPTCTGSVLKATKGIDPFTGEQLYASVPAFSGNVDCHLQSGVANPAVKVLQRDLNDCYQTGLTVDGIYGPATKSKIVSIQNAWGLTADGIYGPGTRKVMSWATRNDYNQLRCYQLL
ncbi:peptidoglycan-binding domain-containing protein [Dactylosporangium sp. McL0621]|uniref:peptidoglycan-binding domain-containing protein n=1 Tax=Dactylosporangium sp. McL0621 TaxID=3415678 RepID=UPI003CE6EC0D